MGTVYLGNEHRTRVSKWCQRNLGPGVYFLHNCEGGYQWRIDLADCGRIRITVADDRMLTMLLLTVEQ